MNFNKKFTFSIIYSLVIFGGIGFLSGALVFNSKNSCDKNKFLYLNPLLECVEKMVVKKHSYAVFKILLTSYISKAQAEGEAENVSVYFRDLLNGPTLGIEEHEKFAPASLLKLPVLLAYQNLKNDEIPDLFERKINVLPSGDSLKPAITPGKTVALGGIYSVRELLDLMIKYSDNASAYALRSYLKELSPKRDLYIQTITDLGITDPKNFFDDTISVKSYGSIFVQLFNSSYFSTKKLSSETLEMMVDNNWHYGIEAGIPSGIKVAHKFGERENFKEGATQLHDCGIVYFPDNPYLLCVMTRGNDINTLANIIRDISKMFYDEMSSRRI